MFFQGYRVVSDSIKLGKNDEGKATGQAACLFETPEDAKNAMVEKQGQNIGHRWVEIYQQTYADYLTFHEGQKMQKFTRAASYVTDNNRARCVKLRGLPFQVQISDVVEFF